MTADSHDFTLPPRMYRLRFRILFYLALLLLAIALMSVDRGTPRPPAHPETFEDQR